MKNVFVYGSLMFEDVWNRVVQHRYNAHDAVLSGYSRLCVRGESYPGLVKSFKGSVDGVVYRDVRAQDIRRLDRFEGKCYRRISVIILSGAGGVLNADTYLFSVSDKQRLSHQPWHPERFRTLHLQRFITRYQGF